MNDPMLFWTMVAAIGQVIGALATAAAVIVTLWIVRSERDARITVYAGLNLLIAGDGSAATDVIVIRITNRGLRAVTISQLGWRTGYFRVGPEWLQTQEAIQTSTPTNFVLEPDKEQTIQLQPAWFSNSESNQMRLEFFNRKLPFRKTPQPTRSQVGVHFIGRKSKYFTVTSSLGHFLATNEIKDGAAQFNERSARKRS